MDSFGSLHTVVGAALSFEIGDVIIVCCIAMPLPEGDTEVE